MTKPTSDRGGCLVAFINILGKIFSPKPESLPYKKRDKFLSAAESSLYHVLSSALRGELIVCPKIRLADIFFVDDRANWQSHFNRISSKHVDYLLCELKSMSPVAGVELDDRSHANSKRKERDEFVRKVFSAAGLPLIRIPARRQYNAQELAAHIRMSLNMPSEQSAQLPPSAPIPVEVSDDGKIENEPICPNCNRKMILRTATKGELRGLRFYGCPNYPYCREKVDIDKVS